MLHILQEESKGIKVSIVMIAYNVEAFIAEAIESVLAQNVNFLYELVIGEDCSTDNTKAIALDYERQFPDKIRVVLHPKNLGLTPNCVATHTACQGEYIALLDSDDYWTDSNKLQKQIDFLDSHPDYSGYGTQSMKIFENNCKEESLFGAEEDTDYTLLDMITHRKFHTSSFVYRRSIWVKCGGIPQNISSNERAIYPMVALFGKIRYSKDLTCVYRFTGKGLSSKIDYRELETDFRMLPWLKGLDAEFPVARFRSFLHLCNYTYGVKKMSLGAVLKHYFGFVYYSFSYFPSNLKDVKWGTIFLFRK